MREGWEIKDLENVCGFQNGFAFKSNSFKYTGTPVVRITNIQNETIDLRKIVYIDRNDYDRDLTKYEIKKGDLLIAMSGATTGKIGFHKSDEVLLLNQRVGKFEPYKNLNKTYLFYFLSTKVEENLAISAGAAQPNLSTEQIKSFQIPIPPLQEQQQIVAILDQGFEAIDQAKANIEKNIANAKELFENTLQKLFDKKDWDLKRLGEIATFKNGMNFTNSSKGQSIEIVGVKNFKNNFWVPIHELENVILDGEMSELYQLKKGDILTVRSNGNPKLIGRTLLADEVSSIVSHSGFTIRIRLNSNTILPTFLCHFLKTAKTIKELVDSGNGVGIKSLNQVSLSSLMIPFPESEQEQQIIVDKIEEISIQTKQIESHYKQKLNNLEDLKKSILQKAFAGALTSPEWTQYSKDGRSPSDETQTNKNPERVT
ncbi:restriction endonuclease subunit S [Flavobacterium gelidilacus]|uniref:restriction endonuclease subunit S n=1 Tax=Flavobacterium gelidilacus TaxID=206041 RepID=UPI0003FCBA05|nr:restriction endonuclease subunit S [Flavobacterium gelidilacus]